MGCRDGGCVRPSRDALTLLQKLIVVNLWGSPTVEQCFGSPHCLSDKNVPIVIWPICMELLM